MTKRMPQPRLTVLLATHNGEEVLPRTLRGYCELEPSPIKWQLIIVDNGSSDATSDIIYAFSEHLPLQILREPKVGKNRALNRGLQASKGQLVILTDDDAVPLPTFLQSWAKFIDTRTDYELFGGTIYPTFETPAPNWILQDADLLIMLFGARDLPEGPVKADEIFGVNMAVRKSVLDRGFRFNEDIGPNAADLHYPMGGESDFCRRLERAGVASWFAREPAVRHIVRAHQFTDKYLAGRSYRLGRGWLCQQWSDGKLCSGLAPRPVIEKGMARPLRHLRMLSPFPLQRRRAIFSYYCERGFQEEHKRREVMRTKAAQDFTEEETSLFFK
jgi:glycosyltransferase involved in cell wall biosynthesis